MAEVWVPLNYVVRAQLYGVFFSHGATPPSGPGSPHYRGCTITLTHTTLARTPLDGGSARRRDLYLTTHSTHKNQTSMPPKEFEPAILASEGPKTHALEGAATGLRIPLTMYEKKDSENVF
jgi:hypothetical protein